MDSPSVKCVSMLLFVALPVVGQRVPAEVPIDASIRASVIETLASKIEVGYVVPETAQLGAQHLRTATAQGGSDTCPIAKTFAEKVSSDLRSVTKDKHLALYFDPQPKPISAPAVSKSASRERFNYGFNKVERLRGNVGYLDLRSFADLAEAKETASTFLSALANFDSIILDLRQNGGGNTPMMAYVASYFLGPKPVHLTTMYWRDENRTIEVLTSETVDGRRSLDRDLFLLVEPSTFSAAEDFCYSLQQLKRATLVGDKTGGGAHMGRGLQRLSSLFTAFIPTGQSINPITKTNWEGIGVEPDVKVPLERALVEAHLLALRKLLERERDPIWQENFRRSMAEVAAGK